MTKQIDWMGRWYDIIKERGENDLPTLILIDLETNDKKDEIIFSHREMDGIGAFVKYYTQKNIQLKNLPALREARLPTFLERITIFWKLLTTSKKITTQWIEKNIGLEPEDPKKIVWKILSKEETSAIESHCLENKYSLCAFLMQKTSEVLLKELSLNHEGTWTLPVNLRPLLKREDYCSNHSSGILIPVSKIDSAKEVHEKIKNYLKNKEHWGIWWVHQIGKIIGYSGMRYVSNRNAQKNFMTGSFSFLGHWDLPSHHIWVGGPPGSKNFPISVMVMLANKQLSFSLKIHPYILKDQTKTSILLEKILKETTKAVAK